MENPLATVSKKLTDGSPLAKFLRLNDPDISKFISSIPSTFSDAIVSVTKAEPTVVSDRVLQNRFSLARIVEKFHTDACTLTAAVKEDLSILQDPDAKKLV